MLAVARPRHGPDMLAAEVVTPETVPRAQALTSICIQLRQSHAKQGLNEIKSAHESVKNTQVFLNRAQLLNSSFDSC